MAQWEDWLSQTWIANPPMRQMVHREERTQLKRRLTNCAWLVGQTYLFWRKLHAFLYLLACLASAVRPILARIPLPTYVAGLASAARRFWRVCLLDDIVIFFCREWQILKFKTFQNIAGQATFPNFAGQAKFPNVACLAPTLSWCQVVLVSKRCWTGDDSKHCWTGNISICPLSCP